MYEFRKYVDNTAKFNNIQIFQKNYFYDQNIRFNY